jgi:hypothetical protein
MTATYLLAAIDDANVGWMSLLGQSRRFAPIVGAAALGQRPDLLDPDQLV